MNTDIANIETPSSSEIVQQAATTFEGSAAQPGRQTKAAATGSSHYTIQVHPAVQSPEFFTGLLSATGSLIACLLLLVVADYKLRAWLKH